MFSVLDKQFNEQYQNEDQYYIIITTTTICIAGRMKQNITRMNFRTMPSTIPLHSPSPDNKTPNCLTPTISPNNIQLKKNITPIKYMQYSSSPSPIAKINTQNKKQNIQQSKHLQYSDNYPRQQQYQQYFTDNNQQNTNNADQRQEQGKDTTINAVKYQEMLKQKDAVIVNLKKIIDVITDKQGRKHETSVQSNRNQHTGNIGSLHNQVKVLTLQNQKLVNVIQKMQKEQKTAKKQVNNRDITLSMEENWEEQVTLKFQNYEKQIEQLTHTIKLREINHQSELQHINKSNLTLATHLKNLEDQKKQLQNQNAKLLRILKQKNETNSRLVKNSPNINSNSNSNSAGLIQSSDVSLQQSQIKSHKSYQRLSLLKIKEQHAQNMRIQRQEIAKEIEQAFDIMKMALESINIKVTGMANRLSSIEKIAWNQAKSVAIVPQQKAKSEIYIEDGPQSSSSQGRMSREQFSQIIDTQRKSKIDAEQQLQQVKQQLEQLRFKYQKICMDTSSVSYSKRIIPVMITDQASQQNRTSEQYLKISQQVKNKSKEIDVLYQQIKLIEIEKLSKQQSIKQYRKIIDRQKLELNNYQQKMEQLKNKQQQQSKRLEHQVYMLQRQMQNKVNMLIDNYQKQIDMLRKQKSSKISKLEQYQTIFKQQNNKLKSQSQLQQKIDKLAQVNKQQCDKLVSHQNCIKQLKQQLQNCKKQQQFNQNEDQTMMKINEQFVKVREESDAFKNQFNALKQQYDAMKQQYDALKQQYDALKQQKQSQQQQNIMQIIKLSQANKQIDNKDEFIRDMENKMQKWCIEANFIKKQMEDISEQKFLLAKQLSAKKQELQTKNHYCQNLDSSYKIMIENVGKLQLGKLKQLLIDYKDIQKQIDAQNQLVQPYTPISKLPKQSYKSQEQQSQIAEYEQSDHNKYWQLVTIVQQKQMRISQLQIQLQQCIKLQEMYKKRYQQSLLNLQNVQSEHRIHEIRRLKMEQKHRKEQELQRLRRKYLLDQVERLQGIMTAMIASKEKSLINVQDRGRVSDAPNKQAIQKQQQKQQKHPQKQYKQKQQQQKQQQSKQQQLPQNKQQQSIIKIIVSHDHQDQQQIAKQ